MSSLVFDTTDRQAAGTAAGMIGIGEARVEVDAASSSNTDGSGHPVDTARANDEKLTTSGITVAASREEG